MVKQESIPGDTANPSKTGPGPVITPREVKWAVSESLPELLAQRNCTLVISTYQTGHVVIVSAPGGQLCVSFHTFERPMGLAIRPGWMVVGTRTQVWSLRDFPELASRIKPAGCHDACYLTRFSHFTGDIRCHELSWVNLPSRQKGAEQSPKEGQLELWAVNTLFSCLCATTASYSFAPRWAPPFITSLVPEDRCHLNGLAVSDGSPRYVTALGETNNAQGWRPGKIGGGCLIDIQKNQTICRGLVMPHSPRIRGNQLLFLNSGLGELVSVDPASGARQTIIRLPGYTRGLAIHENLAFVGMSTVRDSGRDELPICSSDQELKCGCVVVDLTTGLAVASLDFISGIDELFDVQIIPGVRSPFVSGPLADREPGSPPVWTIPS